VRSDRLLRPAVVLLAAGMLVGCAPSGEPSGVPAGPTAADAGADRQSGWEVTVYYTAVESFHDDETVEVRGCLTIDCTNGDDLLGEWPEGFVTAVKDEGTGRITSGEQAGRYLNWASTEGYWLDDAPRDADGGVLVPMRSAAADGVPEGTTVQLVDCGRASGGGPPASAVCDRLKSGDWKVSDEFTPGLGGDRHIDLYLGEEDVDDFTSSPMFTTLTDATLAFTAPTG